MDLLLLGARFLLASVFLVAGLAKLADRDGSRRTIVEFGVPIALATPIGSLLPLVELVVASALIPKSTAWWGALGATSLLFAFTVTIAINLAFGRRPNCQCFGQAHSVPTGWRTLARNAGLTILAAWLVWRGQDHVGPGFVEWFTGRPALQRIALLGAAFGVAQLALATWLILHLMLQNGRLLVRLEALEMDRAGVGKAPKFRRVEPETQLLPGSLPPAFQLPALSGEEVSLATLAKSMGSILLVFTDPGCGPCVALLPDLLRWEHKDNGATPGVVLISRGTLSANHAKFGALVRTPILLQKDDEVAEAYGCFGTPAAVLVRPDGRIAGPPALGIDAIRVLAAQSKAVGVHTPPVVQ